MNKKAQNYKLKSELKNEQVKTKTEKIKISKP